MLIYLGVGLSVTTMCIDLVGIQYIQKIHYFGRKFRGTDILQLLKRKRMLERQLMTGNTEEIMNFIQHVSEQIIGNFFNMFFCLFLGSTRTTKVRIETADV